MDANGQESLGAERIEGPEPCRLECCSTRPVRRSGIICCPTPTPQQLTPFRPPTLQPELSCDFLWDRPTPGQSFSTSGTQPPDQLRHQRVSEDPSLTRHCVRQSQFTPRDYANELHWRLITPPPGNGAEFVLPQRIPSDRSTRIPRRFSDKPLTAWCECCPRCRQVSTFKMNYLREHGTLIGCPSSPPPSLGRTSPSSMTRVESYDPQITPEQYESSSFGTQWSQI